MQAQGSRVLGVEGLVGTAHSDEGALIGGAHSSPRVQRVGFRTEGRPGRWASGVHSNRGTLVGGAQLPDRLPQGRVKGFGLRLYQAGGHLGFIQVGAHSLVVPSCPIISPRAG